MPFLLESDSKSRANFLVGEYLHDHRLRLHPDRRVAALLVDCDRQDRGVRYDNRDPRAWLAKQDNARCSAPTTPSSMRSRRSRRSPPAC